MSLYAAMAKLLPLNLRMIFNKKNKMEDKKPEHMSAEEELNPEELELETGSEVDEEQVEENEDNTEADPLQEMKDKYVRLVAEFDNFRKRTAKERIELINTAGKDVITSMLEVLDDVNRAEQQIDKDENIESVREGAKLVFHKLRSTLQNKGVQPMESVGEDFNPDLHEAITEIPAPTPDMAGKVVDEVEKGYYLNGKLIRYAKVVVGKEA